MEKENRKGKTGKTKQDRKDCRFGAAVLFISLVLCSQIIVFISFYAILLTETVWKYIFGQFENGGNRKET